MDIRWDKKANLGVGCQICWLDRKWCGSIKKLLLRGGGVHHWYLKAILGLQESEYAICTNHTWSLYRVAESLFDGKALNISRETEVFLI